MLQLLHWVESGHLLCVLFFSFQKNENEKTERIFCFFFLALYQRGLNLTQDQFLNINKIDIVFYDGGIGDKCEVWTQKSVFLFLFFVPPFMSHVFVVFRFREHS